MLCYVMLCYAMLCYAMLLIKRVFEVGSVGCVINERFANLTGLTEEM